MGKKGKIKERSPHKIRVFKVGDSINELHEYRDEIDEYTNVLLGRENPPMVNGVMTLVEVANAYYSRAVEMQIRILRAESQGAISGSDPLSKFRKGELRSFIQMAEKAQELGSRRLTAAKLEFEASQ